MKIVIFRSDDSVSWAIMADFKVISDRFNVENMLIKKYLKYDIIEDRIGRAREVVWKQQESNFFALCHKTLFSNVRFEVSTAVTMKNGVFWDATPRDSCKNRRFRGT
jgi:hypothetical protein